MKNNQSISFNDVSAKVNTGVLSKLLAIRFKNLIVLLLLIFSLTTYQVAYSNDMVTDFSSNYANAHFLSPQDFKLYYLPTSNSEERLKLWDPSDSLFEGQITCTSPKCVSIEEVLKGAVANGYPSREKLVSVYQARQRIIGSIGRLIPRLEFSLGRGVLPANILDTVSNLVGFLLPSNWFNWKESKLLYAAEKSSYIGLLRNVVSDTESLYYNIHWVALDLLIYNYYADHLQKLIEDIKDHNKQGKISSDDILQLENLLAEVKSDAAYLNTVISNWYTYDLAVAMAYPDQGAIGINPIPLPDLSKVGTYTIQNSELAQIRINSAELLTFRYIIRAAHYTRFSRIFSFLGTSGSGRDTALNISFGLDNIADIHIARAEEKNLKIKMEESAAKIESSFRKAVDVYNGSVDLYKQYMAAKVPNRALFNSILGKYQTAGTLDTQALIRAIGWALKFELNRNFVQHLFLISQSNMNRLLVQGYYYTDLIDSYRFPLCPDLHWIHDRSIIKENREIDKDIMRELLDINNP